MQILIINGPNLNLLGKREPSIYGTSSFEDYFEVLKIQFKNVVDLDYFQSNHEGAILDKLHEIGFTYDGIVLNGGAYTHTSVAIADAIAAITTPVIEVHISNVHARESFRHHSYFSPKCKGVIVGLGLTGYELAVQALLSSSDIRRSDWV
ncbi:MAG: type II 3-dehydroquinate dehydratase [Bacteroidota bacterium]